MRAILFDILFFNLISCYSNSFAQRRLPDFTASTHLSDSFKMADIAEDLQLLDAVNAKNTPSKMSTD